MTWLDPAGRTFTLPLSELRDWVGQRAQAGRLAPRGFPNSDGHQELVIADVSIDNANVFYELGVRQALRDKWTVLLRCKADKSNKAYDVPFDIKTDRYFAYDRDNPAASLNDLVKALNETVNGDVRKDIRSSNCFPNYRRKTIRSF